MNPDLYRVLSWVSQGGIQHAAWVRKASADGGPDKLFSMAGIHGSMSIAESLMDEVSPYLASGGPSSIYTLTAEGTALLVEHSPITVAARAKVAAELEAGKAAIAALSEEREAMHRLHEAFDGALKRAYRFERALNEISGMIIEADGLYQDAEAGSRREKKLERKLRTLVPVHKITQEALSAPVDQPAASTTPPSKPS